jgi:hypothetical protein
LDGHFNCNNYEFLSAKLLFLPPLSPTVTQISIYRTAVERRGKVTRKWISVKSEEKKAGVSRSILREEKGIRCRGFGMKRALPIGNYITTCIECVVLALS